MDAHREALLWKMSSDDPIPDTTTFGGWIVFHRVTNELTRAKVADEAGISETILKDVEDGERFLYAVDTLFRLAQALRLPQLQLAVRMCIEIDPSVDSRSG
jgi:transcriptional regulator with XRE-family HTH domain